MTSASLPGESHSRRTRRRWRPGSLLVIVAGAAVGGLVLAKRQRRDVPGGADTPITDAAGVPPQDQPAQDLQGPPSEDLQSEARRSSAREGDGSGGFGGEDGWQASELDPTHEVGDDRPDGSPEDRRRWRAPGLVAGAAIVVVLVLLVVRGVVADSETGGVETSPQDDAAEETTEQPTTSVSTTTSVVSLDAPDAFAQASRRLESAGSFHYTGDVEATDVSHVRPGPWLATDVRVEGEVAISSNRVREVATSSGGAAEVVVDGTTVWGRSAVSASALPDQSYQVVTGLSSEALERMGAALLPHWLAAATDQQATGTDAAGRHRFSARIPADEFGEIVRGRGPTEADIVLVLDDDGDPVRVEITSVPDGPLHLVLEISGIGEDVMIDPPPA